MLQRIRAAVCSRFEKSEATIMRSARTLTCFCLPGDIGRVRTRPWRIHRRQILIERSPVGKGVDLREVDNLRRLLGMWLL